MSDDPRRLAAVSALASLPPNFVADALARIPTLPDLDALWSEWVVLNGRSIGILELYAPADHTRVLGAIHTRNRELEERESHAARHD